MTRLSDSYGKGPRERARVRTKELERLLTSVEDAGTRIFLIESRNTLLQSTNPGCSCTESYTDRHNILLFLMRDTMREHPCGFEHHERHRNIFDPEEDIALGQPIQALAVDGKNGNGAPECEKEETETGAENSDGEPKQQPQRGSPLCAREGCSRKPRFDSLFCSDSCGVSALELDLLRSYQESSDIHPSVLRN